MTFEKNSQGRKMVSIVVPVYNTGECIKKCINSLIHQSYSDIEIILIDDGSDFKTASLCDFYAEKYDKIIVNHCAHLGVSAARNYGIEQAHGKYIFFADADDYAEARMIEEMVNIAEHHKTQIVISGYYFDLLYKDKNKWSIKSIEQKIPSFKIESENEWKKEMVFLWDSALMYNVWNKLFILEIIKENRILFPVGKDFNEDRDFVRDYLCHIQTAYVTESCFYHYLREERAGATGIYRPDMLGIRKEEFKRLCNFFINLGIYDSVAKEYVVREHFDRVVGTVENVFHSDLTDKEIIGEIKKIIKDADTKYVMKHVNPKSKKMRILYLFFKTQNALLIYIVMKCIYSLKVKYPVLFYKLRQSR